MFSQVPVGRRFSDTLYHGARRQHRRQRRIGQSVDFGRPAASRINTSSTASTSPTRATAPSGPIRSSSVRSATPRRSTSSRKSRSRPAATKRSSDSPPAASSTSSPRAAATISTVRYSATRGLQERRHAGQQVRLAERHRSTRCRTHVSDAGGEGGGAVVQEPACSSSARSTRPGRPRPFAWRRWDSRSRASIRTDSIAIAGPSATRRRARSQLSSSHRIDASFFGDPSNGMLGPQRGSTLLNQTTAGFSSLTYGGHNQTVRYDGVLSSRFPGRGLLRTRAERHQRDASRWTRGSVTDRTRRRRMSSPAASASTKPATTA